jgi:hypothetical protein
MGFLRNFPDYELIFNEEQTRQILLFFFPPDKDVIDKLPIDNAVRNFAQALLVEAVDTTYAYGYIEAIFMSIYDFLVAKKLSKSFIDFLKILAKKAMKHWFKHATQQGLMNPKIYEYVRVGIQSHCRSQLHAISDQVASKSKIKGRSGVYLATAPDNYNKNLSNIVWG